MILTAEELATIPGRQLLGEIRRVLVDEDDRIRRTQEQLVADGVRRAPDPGQMSKAHRLHAADKMLEHAIAKGPAVTAKELTEQAREAWRLALTREELDASAATELADQPGGDDPPDQVPA